MGAPVVQKPQTQGKIRWGLMAATMAVSLIPLVGPSIAHFAFDRPKHRAEAQEAKKDLAHWYRKQIAAQLGIPAHQVKASDLELAAQSNPTFKAMLDKVEKQQSKDNRAALVGAAIATPLSVTPLNLFGAGAIASKATEVGISMAATTAVGLIGKEYLLVDDVATHINQKRLSGAMISAEDVFMLRLAHDKPLQDALKKQNGTALHKMTAEQQSAVLRSMPDGYYAYAANLARKVNLGELHPEGMSEQDLVIAASKSETQRLAQVSQGAWVNRVGGSRAAQGSFVEQQRARAAAAAGQGFAPTM